MTLEEIKAQHPEATVVNPEADNIVDAVYEYLSSIVWDEMDVPLDGVIFFYDDSLFYYVDCATLRSVCPECEDVDEWLDANNFIEMDSTFFQLTDEDMAKFRDLVSKPDYEEAFDSFLNSWGSDCTALYYFNTPYGDAWDPIHAYWLTVLASKVEAAAIEYSQD